MSDINLTGKQKLVVNTSGKTILVSASAGSGKTFVVVERIIKRIIEDKIDIDKILVVTFTNAAASELKERIVKRLHEKLKENSGDKEIERYIHKQVRLASRSNISTIHSFCLSVIRSSFYYLEIEPSVKTIEQTKASIMMLEILNNILETEYEKKETAFEDCLELFVSEDNLIKAILDLYYFAKNIENYSQWLDNKKNMYMIEYIEGMDLTDTQIGPDIVINVKKKFKLIKIKLEGICHKLRGMPEFTKRLEILENLLEKVEKICVFNKYDDIYSYLPILLDNKDFRGMTSGAKELRDESSSVMKKVVEEIKKIGSIIYKDTKGVIQDLNSMANVIGFLIDIVKKLDEEYMLEKNKKGYIDFNDYEHLTLKALNNEIIRKEYLEKFEEIYIDEYQDTSSIQEEVISKISKLNNVVMVGDLKQSIYSFRNAEPSLLGDKYESYEDILDEVTGDDINSDIEEYKGKIILSNNYRSRKEVLGSTNYIFSRIMSKEYGGLDYTEKEALVYSGIYDNELQDPKESNETSTYNKHRVEINIVDLKEDENDNEDDNGEPNSFKASGEEVDETGENVLEEIKLSRKEITKVELEAMAVGKKINELISGGFNICDIKTKTYRPCEYRDIVILMRAPSLKSQVISDVLEKMNIPVFYDNAQGFYESEEVGLVISFLKVLDNHLDDISLASIMYSIIGKFTLDDMVCIKRYESNGYLYNSLVKCREEIKDTEINNKIDNFFKLINEFRNYVRIYSVSETIEKMYMDTGIYYSFYLEEYGESKCMKLDTLVELAKDFEREEKALLTSFIKYIESIKKRGDKGESSPRLLGENENVIRIMTIHKSKGLEFPIVLLCDSNKVHDMRDSRKMFVLNKELGIGINIYDKNLGISYPSVIKQSIKERMKDKVISEELRLLYVAMTRAKEKLCIFGVVKDAEKLMQKASEQGLERSIDKDLVKVANSYLKVILLSVYNGHVNKEEAFVNNFEVNIFKQSDNNITNNKDVNNMCDEDNSIYKCNISTNNLDRSISLKDKFVNVANKLYEDNNKVIENKEGILDNSLSLDMEKFKQERCKEYKYIESSNIKKKYTVTELKEKGKNKKIDTNDINHNSLDKNSSENNIYDRSNNIMPKVLECSIDSMSYGTVIHKIIEKIDLSNKNITKEEIENISKTVISRYDKSEKYNLGKISDMIYEFLNSEIRIYLDNAKEIKKELEYVSLNNLSEIDELKMSEETLIQGIVDVYIETKDGRRIIIDFKTDKVETQQELIDRYKYQLKIYKSGIENIIQKEIDILYIYSFTLKRLVRII